jgi:predicted ribosomally synthesized peptide with SipW-like signal peptide
MNRSINYSKLMMSVGIIVFGAALVIGATGAFFSDTETSNANTFTAGAIDLTVDSTQHYNHMVCTAGVEASTWQPEPGFTPEVGHYPVTGSPCTGTWTATDLGAQQFWNFTDVKPGDEGENTVSLHIDSNPAWACVDVSLTKNDDVTCNDPETAAEGANCNNSIPSADFDGELAQNLKFAAWADDGDNIWEVNEPLLFSNQSGPASDVLGGKTYALADVTTGSGPMPGGTTNYIGLAWCAGNQTVDTLTHTITCDGAAMGNDTQTDSMQANVAFRVVQSRNNPNFVCNQPIN